MTKRVVAHTDLEARVEARRRELIVELIEHKKSLRIGAVEMVDKLKGRLLDLATIVKSDLSGGWANLDPSAKLRLEDWIAR